MLGRPDVREALMFEPKCSMKVIIGCGVDGVPAPAAREQYELLSDSDLKCEEWACQGSSQHGRMQAGPLTAAPFEDSTAYNFSWAVALAYRYAWLGVQE